MKQRIVVALAAFWLSASASALAQTPPPAPPRMMMPAPTPNDTLVSPEVAADGSVTLRIYAPNAREVQLGGSDLTGPGNTQALSRADNGVWSVTLHPAPGTYRYAFRVDGVSVADPRNPETSSQNTTVQSVVHINGSAAGEDRQAVPHGALAEVYYPSPEFGELRRMHIYTPPGYERGSRRYPVLYLLHGAFDSDDSWGTVGRANFILDNLIASGAAEPMIVVMPAGHYPNQTNVMTFAQGEPGQDPFGRDFMQAVLPYVEGHYRVRTDANSRALAGLSMGGLQTLNIGLSNLDRFRYIGVFSSGFFQDELIASFDSQRGAAVSAHGNDLRLFYFAWGREDWLAGRTQATLAYFDSKHVSYVRHETGGGHTWDNWREYLHDFAPRLFR